MTYCQTTATQRRLERLCGLFLGLWVAAYAIDIGRHQAKTPTNYGSYALQLRP